jgi:hypothetical protein
MGLFSFSSSQSPSPSQPPVTPTAQPIVNTPEKDMSGLSEVTAEPYPQQLNTAPSSGDPLQDAIVAGTLFFFRYEPDIIISNIKKPDMAECMKIWVMSVKPGQDVIPLISIEPLTGKFVNCDPRPGKNGYPKYGPKLQAYTTDNVSEDTRYTQITDKQQVPQEAWNQLLQTRFSTFKNMAYNAPGNVMTAAKSAASAVANKASSLTGGPNKIPDDTFGGKRTRKGGKKQKKTRKNK